MKNITEYINLINDNGSLGIFILLILLSFSMGVIFTIIFTSAICKEKVIEVIKKYFENIKRFLRNFISLSPIVIVLFVIYFIFKYFGYGAEILPELIGASISIFIINFILNERSYSEKRNLKELLDKKILKIYELSKDMILNYIDFKEYNQDELSRELLINILGKQDLFQSEMEFINIDEHGVTSKNNIPKIDFPYFIGKKLKPIVEDLINNYGPYLDYYCLTELIKLEEELNKKIFKARISKIPGLGDGHQERYLAALVESLIKINSILLKIKK